MVRKNRQNATNRVTLTPQKVVEGALSLADSEGLGAVTIRRLAKELGVTPMALYWHFGSKGELLDGMAASIFEEVDLSVDASARWQEQLRALLGSMLGVLRAHPSSAILLSTRTASNSSSFHSSASLRSLGRTLAGELSAPPFDFSNREASLSGHILPFLRRCAPTASPQSSPPQQ